MSPWQHARFSVALSPARAAARFSVALSPARAPARSFSVALVYSASASSRSPAAFARTASCKRWIAASVASCLLTSAILGFPMRVAANRHGSVLWQCPTSCGTCEATNALPHWNASAKSNIRCITVQRCWKETPLSTGRVIHHPSAIEGFKSSLSAG